MIFAFNILSRTIAIFLLCFYDATRRSRGNDDDGQKGKHDSDGIATIECEHGKKRDLKNEDNMKLCFIHITFILTTCFETFHTARYGQWSWFFNDHKARNCVYDASRLSDCLLSSVESEKFDEKREIREVLEGGGN